jgi:O-antigen/teichoic acid export membrane protein
MIGIPILITTGLYYLHFGNVLLGSALICISPFFPALSPLEAWKHFFKGKSLFNYYAALNSLLVVIRFGLVVAFLFITKHIVFILLAHFAAQSLLHISFHTYALHIARKGKQKIEPDWKKQSFALSILSFSQTIFGTMDMVIIGNLLALDQVAIYGIVMKLVDLFIKFFRNFSQSLAPTLFKKTHVNIKKFIGAALLLFTAPTILFFTIKPLIIFVYSEQYIACIPLLQTYVWIIPIAVSAKFCNIFLVKHKLNLEINITRITSIILVILCYFTLIPLLGIWGGIVGSMVYYTSELVLTLYFLKRKKLF